MNVFWNDGEREIIQGLDVLGLRSLDQTIERRLVSGITTISFRARFITLVPWLLWKVYQKQIKDKGKDAQFDMDQLAAAFTRLEVVALAASHFGTQWGENGNTYGVPGSTVHGDILGDLEKSGKAALPTEGSGGVYGTYAMPCRGFGLLKASPAGTGIPASITDRGKKVCEIREQHGGQGNLAKVILDGGELTMEALKAEGRFYSTNGLLSCEEELKALRECLLTPPAEGDTSIKIFRESVRWALGYILEVPHSSDDILASNYRATLAAATPAETQLGWLEYELRRRGHFALELLLCAATRTLADIVQGTTADIVATWKAGKTMPPLLQGVMPLKKPPFGEKYAAVAKSIPDGAFLGDPVPVSQARGLSAAPQALYALALLSACHRQSAALRASGRLPTRKHYLDRTFSLLDASGGERLGDLMPRLLRECVLEPHLATTLRKLSQGQKCSLRFYPEGALLHPTGIQVAAGYSGDRLHNVLGFLADAGYANRAGRNFSILPAGTTLHAELEAGA